MMTFILKAVVFEKRLDFGMMTITATKEILDYCEAFVRLTPYLRILLCFCSHVVVLKHVVESIIGIYFFTDTLP